MRTSKCEYAQAACRRSGVVGGGRGAVWTSVLGQAAPSWSQSRPGLGGAGGGTMRLRETDLSWGGQARMLHTQP